MSRIKSVPCLISVITFALLLSAMAAAQDAGQYLILNAQYGNERNHVDVTRRLREIARRDQVLRISYQTMAVDPDQGQAKVLRVFARGPSGQERYFDFPDGTVFDGAQFRAWGRGDWGDEHWNGGWYGRTGNDAGDYVILSAQYGNEYRHVDVTDQLKRLARQDRVFRLDYRTFGVDPAQGEAKALHIFARGADGQERMFEYQDNSLVDGAIFRGWGEGNWGGGGWSGNWYGGGYRRDEGQFVILSAQYGNERHHVDVTRQLREMARTDQQFVLDFRTFGVDPDRGRAKVLRIFARGPNGRERMFEYQDNTVIDGARFRGWGRGEWAGENDHWSGRWEGEERDDRDHDRDHDREHR